MTKLDSNIATNPFVIKFLPATNLESNICGGYIPCKYLQTNKIAPRRGRGEGAKPARNAGRYTSTNRPDKIE